jgi:hypothetical protein
MGLEPQTDQLARLLPSALSILLHRCFRPRHSGPQSRLGLLVPSVLLLHSVHSAPRFPKARDCQKDQPIHSRQSARLLPSRQCCQMVPGCPRALPVHLPQLGPSIRLRHCCQWDLVLQRLLSALSIPLRLAIRPRPSARSAL